MLLRKTPLSKKLTSDEIESKLKDVVTNLEIHTNDFFHLKIHLINCLFSFQVVGIEICSE